MFGPGFWETSRFSFPADGARSQRTYGADAPDGLNRYGGTAVLEPGGFRGSWNALQFGGWDDTRAGQRLRPAAGDQHEHRDQRQDAEAAAGREHAARPLLRRHHPAPRPLDGHRRRRRRTRRRATATTTPATTRRSSRSRSTTRRARPGSWVRASASTAPTTRSRCCCPTVASGPPATTTTRSSRAAAARPTAPRPRTRPRSTSRPTCSRKGPRPKIKKVATEIGYGDKFGIRTAAAAARPPC